MAKATFWTVVLFIVKYSTPVDNCVLSLVESIPVGMTYPPNYPKHLSTTDSWIYLIDSTNQSLDIASMYWTMQGSDVVADPSASDGETVFAALLAKAGLLRVVKSSSNDPDPDSELLLQHAAQLRILNMTQLIGAGIIHTKAFISDGADFYLGSANMDWRSLTQVKELGILGVQCPELALDLAKIFSVYWLVGELSEIPASWPAELETEINANAPVHVVSQSITYSAYFSSSPPQFSPRGRTQDLDAVLSTIREAEKFVHIAVMDYFPLFIYTKTPEFWGVIDDELRRAYVDRKVNVKLLVSNWPHTRQDIVLFCNSLTALNGYHTNSSIEVKYFTVPSNASFDQIPYSRVNHNKYMITDKAALIGTSNWSADYFTDTAGISLVLKTDDRSTPGVDCDRAYIKSKEIKTINQDLSDIFSRDWCSEYASFEKPA